jgi:SAM-dependent methyltransferase
MGGRRWWEEQWAASDPRFGWYVAEAPSELVDLLDSGVVPEGTALDVGCGDGIFTSYLARRFGPAVGVDVAMPAVRRAVAREDGGRAHYAVAAAPDLPFGRDAFALVLDRGCMHLIPPRLYGRYLEAVERVLRPGGHFVLFFPRSTAAVHTVVTIRRRLRGRPGPRRPSLEQLVAMVPAGLEVRRAARIRYRAGGHRRQQLVLVARRR